MLVLLAAALLVLGPAIQEPPPPPKTAPRASAAAPGQSRFATAQFDANGYPIVPDERPAMALPAPGGETAATPAPPGPLPAFVTSPPVPALASGMQLGSPLLEVFQGTRSPAAFKALAGVVVWWRLTIYGAQGEVIGVREITHTADCAFAERDRIEHADGRVYGRSGASVFAERQGMPWPTLADSAQHELMLFGLQLRVPWCFADSQTFVVVGRDTVDRSGEPLARAIFERRPPAELDVVGPDPDPKPRDRFELLYEPSTGLPREFVHRFASTQQTRRVLLEDWRDVQGVRMPHRRTYVDATLRQTTTLEILRIEAVRLKERDFRLH